MILNITVDHSERRKYHGGQLANQRVFDASKNVEAAELLPQKPVATPWDATEQGCQMIISLVSYAR